jgi:negative regulator of replication initiation
MSTTKNITKPDTNLVRKQIYFDPEVYSILSKDASKLGKSTAEVIRNILKEYQDNKPSKSIKSITGKYKSTAEKNSAINHNDIY